MEKVEELLVLGLTRTARSPRPLPARRRSSVAFVVEP
jgi:hypothetical protein